MRKILEMCQIWFQIYKRIFINNPDIIVIASFIVSYLTIGTIAVVSLVLDNTETVFMIRFIVIALPAIIIGLLIYDLKAKKESNQNQMILYDNKCKYIHEFLYGILQDHNSILQIECPKTFEELKLYSNYIKNKYLFVFSIIRSSNASLGENEFVNLLEEYFARRSLGYYEYEFQCHVNAIRMSDKYVQIAIWVGMQNEDYQLWKKTLKCNIQNNSTSFVEKSKYIRLAYDKITCKMKCPLYVKWDYIKLPHMIIIGGTGSGKTYLAKIILANMARTITKISLFVCDYKAGGDFKFLSNCDQYYEYKDCIQGFRLFYKKFVDRQSGQDICRDCLVLFFDEWAAFCSNLEKKEAEDIKSKLADILMLGRSFNVHLILCQQRPDAAYFHSGARDNFGVAIGMGNLSNEAKTMLFQDFKEEMTDKVERGSGYILMEGAALKSIIVPEIKGLDQIDYYIRNAVNGHKEKATGGVAEP